MSVQRQQARLGFFDGIGAFFGGVGFVVFRPAVWGWALVPIAVASLRALGLGGLAIWGGSAVADAMLASASPTAWATIGLWALRALLWLVGLVVAFLVAMSLAQPLSGFALDAIARRQELALGGRSWPEQPTLPSAFRSLRVSLTALAVVLPAIAILTVVTFAFPPASVVTVPLKVGVTGLAAAYDFLDYPLSLRGVGVRARLTFIRAHLPAVLGFGLGAAACLLVPGGALLLLPFGVAGASRLVVATDPH